VAPAPPHPGVDSRVDRAHDGCVGRSAPWKPTAAQDRTAARLCDPQVGAYVRGRPDGALELRTLEHGGFRRYLVHRDGTATLVESRPETARHVWGHSLLIGGGILAFATAAAMVSKVVEATGFAAAIVAVGIAACCVGELLVNPTIVPRGQGWKQIGGADF
jgi:hypothetical protein